MGEEKQTVTKNLVQKPSHIIPLLSTLWKHSRWEHAHLFPTQHKAETWAYHHWQISWQLRCRGWDWDTADLPHITKLPQRTSFLPIFLKSRNTWRWSTYSLYNNPSSPFVPAPAPSWPTQGQFGRKESRLAGWFLPADLPAPPHLKLAKHLCQTMDGQETRKWQHVSLLLYCHNGWSSPGPQPGSSLLCVMFCTHSSSWGPEELCPTIDTQGCSSSTVKQG